MVYTSGPLHRKTHWAPEQVEGIIGERFKLERRPPLVDESLAHLLGQILDPSAVTRPADRNAIERLEFLMESRANEKILQDCMLWAIWYLSSLEVKNTGGRLYRNVQKIDRLLNLSFAAQLPGLVDLLLSKTNVWKFVVDHLADPRWRFHKEVSKWVRTIIEKGEGAVLDNLITKYFEGGRSPNVETTFSSEMTVLLEMLVKKPPAQGKTGPHNFHMVGIRLQKFFNNQWVMLHFKHEFFTFVRYRGNSIYHLSEYIQQVPNLFEEERLALITGTAIHSDNGPFGIQSCEFILAGRF